MPQGPAARILDNLAHPLPPGLSPGPGSLNVFIGGRPAWRGVLAAVASALSAAKQVSNAAIKTAEAATLAAAGTPGAPAAKAAEETTKATAAATMGSMIASMAGMSDIHACATLLPLPPHGPGVVIDGSQTVLINNLPACRLGDTVLEAVGPPNKIVTGEFTVMIGDQGSASAPVAGSGAPVQQSEKSIVAEMQQDAQQQQMERWKILQDTQNRLFEIQQEVTTNKAKTQDKMYQKWKEYIDE